MRTQGGPYRYLDHDGPIAFAHRGGASEAPENTMPAFDYAVKLGYRYIETDVHATADGVLLAFHDRKLDRVTDATGAIADLPYSEVAKARVDGRAPIPLLQEVLTTWPELRINIDPKADNAVGPLIDVVQATSALDRVCIGSFSGRRLKTIRSALGPGLCTAAAPIQAARLLAASRGFPVGVPSGVAAAQVPIRQGPLTVVTKRFVDFAHDHDIQVHVWTIDEEPTMDQLLDMGVDGVMTDRPAVLRQVLERRGQWTRSEF
jgi:glycerophosphoryl diester phosphodiesterase